MLVLTRKVGEEIRVGDDIVITILEIRGHRVRVGIKAPITVSVDRNEVRLRKKARDDTSRISGQFNTSRRTKTVKNENVMEELCVCDVL